MPYFAKRGGQSGIENRPAARLRPSTRHYRAGNGPNACMPPSRGVIWLWTVI